MPLARPPYGHQDFTEQKGLRPRRHHEKTRSVGVKYCKPWRSKAKQRTVLGTIHVKDSLLPMGKIWSSDFLGKGFFGPTSLSFWNWSLFSGNETKMKRLKMKLTEKRSQERFHVIADPNEILKKQDFYKPWCVPSKSLKDYRWWFWKNEGKLTCIFGWQTLSKLEMCHFSNWMASPTN